MGQGEGVGELKGRFKSPENWIYQHRALSLLLAVVLTLALVGIANWLSGSDLFRQFFFPKVCDKRIPTTCAPLEWKDLFQAAILVLGLPVAFLLWHWRDTNVRDQIENSREQVENARKDTNLKEFQEVQLRAAGALDEKLPQEAREQLQIAALHQLRGFLRGDYGESFKRPAFELLLAGHAAAVHRIGVEAVQLSLKSIDAVQLPKQIMDEKLKLQSKLTKVDSARMLIIEDEWKAIFESPFPMTNRNFDLLSFRELVVPAGVNFLESSFFGTVMVYANLQNICFNSTTMEGAVLSSAKLNGSSFSSACLDAADFSNSQMKSVTMCIAGLGGVLPGASLRGARFVMAKLQGSNFTDADADGATFLHANLDEVNGMSVVPLGSRAA